MPIFFVEVEHEIKGRVSATYKVESDSIEQASENWHNGENIHWEMTDTDVDYTYIEDVYE